MLITTDERRADRDQSLLNDLRAEAFTRDPPQLPYPVKRLSYQDIGFALIKTWAHIAEKMLSVKSEQHDIRSVGIYRRLSVHQFLEVLTIMPQMHTQPDVPA